MLKALAFSGLILISNPDFGPSDKMFDDLLAAPNEEEAKDQAHDIWSAWMESGSDAADLVMERAVNAQAAGRLELARALYDRVIAIQPDYAEAWHRRASLFLETQAIDEALRDLNETIRLEPRHFGAWVVLGGVLEALGAKQEAIEAYEEALKIYPEMPTATSAIERLKVEKRGRPV